MILLVERFLVGLRTLGICPCLEVSACAGIY